MNKLTLGSRIILAIASLLLIAVYFTPIWRIDLFAPQYPEGLTMKIWHNTIKGEIEIINGLNHYIGMRHISVEMFPEFDFLKYVIAFYILLGLAVAFIGNRVILFWYLVFTAFGGLFALYDYYRWGYEYGHNLDPTAPIKVPGLSYQPPILGHKRLLNFDAYSFPDVGGWIVIAAASIAFVVWALEKYKAHKRHKKSTPVASMIVISMLALSSCASQPEPFKYGEDVCSQCKMTIMDPKFGSELVTNKGKVFKFDDIGCMVQFLKSGQVERKAIKHNVTVNFEKQGDLIDTDKAFFAVSDEIRSPMNYGIAAFRDKRAAESFISGKKGSVMTWNDVYNRTP